jgi:predicted NBD/HSP70 family sugar kinase
MNEVIGLDIGGTKISGIVYDGKTILRELTVATPKNLEGFKKAVEKLVSLLRAGREVKGLGVGLAGIVNDKGSVVYSPNMKFLDGFNVGKFCKGFNFKTVQIDNDANCFALAESRLGKGKSYKNFVGLTLGTGVGGGIICDKQLFRGSRGSAGEVGHIMADFKYDSEHYYQAARDKNDFKKMGEVMGLLFANIINILDVEAIVLGGTVAIKFSRDFVPQALKVVKKHVVNKNNLPKILISNIKNSGSLGAALLVLW